MKRTLTLLAILAAIGPAWGAEVVSSNIVGYHRLTLTKGYNMIGASFQDVGTANVLTVNDAMSATGLKGEDWTYESEDPDGDQMLVWDSGTQMYTTILTYAGDTYVADMDDYGAEVSTWFDAAAGKTAEDTMANGQAVWIKTAQENATITISGEVPTTASDINLGVGFTMIANPYPKAVAVNDLFTATGLKGEDWTYESENPDGDQLLIWNAGTQTYSAILTWAGDTYIADMDDYGAEPGKWFDSSVGATATTEIPPSGAFWIKTANTGAKISFK